MPTEASSILLEVAVGPPDGVSTTSVIMEAAVGAPPGMSAGAVVMEVAVADDPLYITGVVMEVAVADDPLHITGVIMEVAVFSPPSIRITSAVMEIAVPSFFPSEIEVSPYQGGSPIKGRALAGRGLIPFGWRDRDEDQ